MIQTRQLTTPNLRQLAMLMPLQRPQQSGSSSHREENRHRTWPRTNTRQQQQRGSHHVFIPWQVRGLGSGG